MKTWQKPALLDHDISPWEQRQLGNGICVVCSNDPD
jgi:hypothetical protein